MYYSLFLFPFEFLLFSHFFSVDGKNGSEAAVQKPWQGQEPLSHGVRLKLQQNMAEQLDFILISLSRWIFSDLDSQRIMSIQKIDKIAICSSSYFLSLFPALLSTFLYVNVVHDFFTTKLSFQHSFALFLLFLQLNSPFLNLVIISNPKWLSKVEKKYVFT